MQKVKQECVVEISDSQADIDTDSRMWNVPSTDLTMFRGTDPDLDVKSFKTIIFCCFSLPTYKGKTTEVEKFF